MNTSSDYKIQKPSIIQALLSGFNTIANKPYLLIFPILLDLFLWFGPAWRVDQFFMPLITALSGVPAVESFEFEGIIENYQVIWQEIITNLNLANTLRTLPVGVPSLMVSKQTNLNPLGRPPIFSLESSIQVLGFWILFLLIGYFLGNLYFKNISNQIIDPINDKGLKTLLYSYLQIILLPLLLLIILTILGIPVLLLITMVTLISPAIGQYIVLISAIIILWIILPLIFTPHGIFLYKQNLIAAMMTSINVVRISMGKTAWFLVLSLILIEGFDYLWRTPTVDNWFLIVGIFGHAFIVTAVIAASFHYFIDATKFTQTILNRKMKSA